ncbi:LysR family transcriptional regulator [Proteiniclasticum sp. C24MP]|uniref:LysR family transcriptional regulator n=1 Tax=Proteiniclasticum sp. C24MP TaxID=3374101 RepID=UPI0037546BFA
MDINQLKYFIAIVENDLNLSVASKKLHISQPALSKYIIKFEEEEKVRLFERSHGRLTGLTPAGENFYGNAQIVIEKHDHLMKEFRDHGSLIKGTVRIGIPPLILTVLFTEVMADLIRLNPDIRFIIVEKGAFELRRMLLLDELDLAVLLHPTNLNELLFKEEVIREDALSAFMSKDNPLAAKNTIEWTDLKGKDLAVFNETFMIHHQLMRKFQSLKMEPKISLMSGSWDFLLEVTRTSNFITILPAPIKEHFSFKDVTEVSFKKPISWQVVMTYKLKSHYTRIEEYTIDSIRKYFKEKKKIESLRHE